MMHRKREQGAPKSSCIAVTNRHGGCWLAVPVFAVMVTVAIAVLPSPWQISAYGQVGDARSNAGEDDNPTEKMRAARDRENAAFQAWSRSIVVVGKRVNEVFEPVAKIVREFSDISTEEMSGQLRVELLTEISDVSEKARRAARVIQRLLSRQFPDPRFVSPEYKESVKIARNFYLSVFGEFDVSALDKLRGKEADSIYETIPLQFGETVPAMIDRNEIAMLSALREGGQRPWALHPIRLIRTALQFENSALIMGHNIAIARKKKAEENEILSLMVRQQIDRGIGLGIRSLALLSANDGRVDQFVEKRIRQGQDAVNEAVIMTQGRLEDALNSQVIKAETPVAEVRRRAPALERRLQERLRWIASYTLRAERDIADQATVFLNVIADFERENYAESLVDMIDGLRRINARRQEVAVRRTELENALLRVNRQNRMARFPISVDGKTPVRP